MHFAYVAVTACAALANAAIATADFTRARFVLNNSAAVGVPESWLTPLGLLKAAGAAGLALGLLGIPWVAQAAAVGLVLFFVGAIATHVRAGDRSFSVLFPGGYLLLALVTLVLGLTK